jgi:hypothetical protein
MEEFNGKSASIDKFVDASFIRDDLKALYKQTYKDKLTRLKVISTSSKRLQSFSEDENSILDLIEFRKPAP